MGKIRRVSIAGSGNVATHLAPAIVDSGVRIVNIFSQNENHASFLAKKVGAKPVNDLAAFDTSVDCIIIAIPDQAISQFACNFRNVLKFDGLVVHTSGSQPLSVLSDMFAHAGVFYPLQSFNRFSNPELKKIPICIEATKPEIEQSLVHMAGLISDDVRLINSEQRAMIHLAAVFACNFTNHMYALAADILEMAGVESDILKPLISETANRVDKIHPGFLQTGPAIRGDQITIDRHLTLLNDHPEIIPIYRQISESIIRWDDKNKIKPINNQHE